VDCGPIKSSSVDEQTQLNKIRPVPHSEFLDNKGYGPYLTVLSYRPCDLTNPTADHTDANKLPAFTSVFNSLQNVINVFVASQPGGSTMTPDRGQLHTFAVSRFWSNIRTITVKGEMNCQDAAMYPNQNFISATINFTKRNFLQSSSTVQF
jgi:hypothetical protein